MPRHAVFHILALLLIAVGMWGAWRAVNYPGFADFLIATEAEMNKVSWSTRKRLVQDTIVVLVTVLLFTLFLLVIDQLWGWILTRENLGGIVPKPVPKGAEALKKWEKDAAEAKAAGKPPPPKPQLQGNEEVPW